MNRKPNEIKGLTSPEIRNDETIPFFDDANSTETLADPPIKPKRDIDKDKIHASDLGEVHTSPNNDTIVVNTPEGTLYITLEPDFTKKPVSPCTESTDITDSLSSPSTSKAHEQSPGANESEELIQSEREERKAGLRRNSISMPTLQNLESEVLKQYMNSPQEGMRVRKKANLRVVLPTYPDYVEMPPEVRRLTASVASPSTEANDHGKPDFENNGEADVNNADGNEAETHSSVETQDVINSEMPIGRPLPNYDMPSCTQNEHEASVNDTVNVQIFVDGKPLPNYEDKPDVVVTNVQPMKESQEKVSFVIGSPLPNYEDLPIENNDEQNIDSKDNLDTIVEIGRPLPNYDESPRIRDSHQDYYPKTNSKDDPARANLDIGRSFPNYEDRPHTPEIKILESNEDMSQKKDEHHVNFGEVVYRKISRSSMSVPYGMHYGDRSMKQNEMRIPEHHQSTGSGFSDGDHDDHHEVLTDDDRAKAPLRSPRRKSGAPRRLRSEFSMDEDYSPSNSVTSVNSLASLLKEKLQSIPQKMRKKPTDYKLRAFVGLMFLAIVFFVSFAYVLYHQQALTKDYFETVQFNEPKRLIRIFGKDDVEILRASLSMGLGKVKAFPCLPEHRHSDGSECLEWLHNLRFYLKMIPHDPGLDNTTCYAVHWKALRPNVYPNDCFDWGETKVHWYGGGQSLNLTWPLDTGSIDYTPFITGDIQKSQFGNVLTRYLINSKGAAVIINDETPLHISVNKGGKQICLKSQYDEFAYANRLTEFPEMRYNICTSNDMKSLHSSIHSHRRAPLWDGLKPADIQTLDSLISEPVWQIAPRFKHELQAETISKYTEDVINLGFLKQGHVLINEHWQNEIGDLTVDTSRFETLNDTVDKLHRRGFKVAFTIQPYISTESKNFAECVQKRLLISERNSDRRIPALTRFKSLASAGMLDITNNRSIPWILEKLQTVIDQYHIDSFYFDLGTAYDMPHYYRCEKFLINPDQYKTHFTKTFEKTLNIIGVSSAVSLPRPPIFVSLPPFESSWEALRTVIPTMLTYGVNGLPFIMPGAVGGDIYWPGSEQFLPSSRGPVEAVNATHENGIALPERELYVRWLQMATFLPVMKFTHLPSKYNDERVLEMAKNLTLLRQKLVAPLLLKYKREALEEGLPLIRPLWLVAGGDAALLVQDEFAIGDEIVVAPILEQGQTTREVYLPSGLWQDGIDGSLRKGNRWMHDYKVPLHRVAYFIRRPDDMRFR